MSVLVLSIDPGVVNCAATVFTVNANSRYKILATGFIQNTVKDMKIIIEQVVPFMEELDELQKTYGKFDFVVAERFQSRGRFNGTSIECINVMIGAMAALHNERFRLFTAATWKNSVNRVIKLDSLYSIVKKAGKTNHELDSFLIGSYMVSKELGLPLYDYLKESDRFLNHFCRTPIL